MAGVAKETTQDVDGGQNIGWIANGDHVRFDNVELRLDTAADVQRPGRLRGGGRRSAAWSTCGSTASPGRPSAASPSRARAAGRRWRTVPANIVPTTGTHTVYLTFDSGQPADFVNVNWFTFS